MTKNDLFNLLFDNQKIKEELDKLYWTDIEYYSYRVQKVKDAGFRVFRNNKGEHKICLKQI